MREWWYGRGADGGGRECNSVVTASLTVASPSPSTQQVGVLSSADLCLMWQEQTNRSMSHVARANEQICVSCMRQEQTNRSMSHVARANEQIHMMSLVARANERDDTYLGTLSHRGESVQVPLLKSARRFCIAFLSC
jgi:hypothetical protein